MLSTLALPNTIVVNPPPIDGITIGAMTSIQSLADDITINVLYTALAELAHTLGGSSVDMFSPWTELLTIKSPASTALMATITLFKGVFDLGSATKELPRLASDWCPSTFASEPILCVTLPPFWGASAYERSSDSAHPNSQLEVVILLEWTFDDFISLAQIMLIGAQSTPLRMKHVETALIGAFLSSAAITAAMPFAAKDLAVRAEDSEHSKQLLNRSIDLVSQALHRFKSNDPPLPVRDELP